RSMRFSYPNILIICEALAVLMPSFLFQAFNRFLCSGKAQQLILFNHLMRDPMLDAVVDRLEDQGDNNQQQKHPNGRFIGHLYHERIDQDVDIFEGHQQTKDTEEFYPPFMNDKASA